MYFSNRPYTERDPQTIRDDFYELIEGFDDWNSLIIAQKLGKYLPTDTLREFMNDLAMDRA